MVSQASMAVRTWPPLIGLLLLTSGCLGLGGVSPAYVPNEDLPASWSEEDRVSQAIAMGLGELETIGYESSDGFAGVTVATLNDVPFVDERSRVVPAAIDKIEEQYGVTLEESGSTTIDLANQGGQAQGTVYDVQGAPADAKAVMFAVDCDPFVLVLGYGTSTDTAFTEALYGEAKTVAAQTVCPT